MTISEESKRIGRCRLWCGLAAIFWIAVDCNPSCYAYPLALGVINTVLALLMLPMTLLYLGLLGFFQDRKYRMALMCAVPGVMISEVLNVIPNNPFALVLPFLLELEVLTLIKLERAKAAEKVCHRLLSVISSNMPDNVMKIATTRSLLSTALLQQGRYAESESMSRSAIEI